MKNLKNKGYKKLATKILKFVCKYCRYIEYGCDKKCYMLDAIEYWLESEEE